ncbi:hypothetical protein [Lelliottia sp. WAP21]|uniref:hypothetical protein n=1 Tax=Lelliottia sp. WAP21 TaxID=2877426 RepID=UPI001E652098|nr:hypothetical protein [Lelliottia sp. WAP21]
MERDDSGFLVNEADLIEIELFSLHDPDFVTKYRLLSALWAKLIQLNPVTIMITNNHVALRLFTAAPDRDVILKTYMDEVRNVFTFSK